MKTIQRLVLVTGCLVAPSLMALTGKTLYNYVAYDAAFWPKSSPANAAEYQKVALDRFKDVKFDTLVFAPAFGFGSMAANLKSASYPKHQPSADSKWMRGWKNAMPELIKAGVDPIAETSKWCRKQKREAVVALPVNLGGTHSGRPNSNHGLSSWYCYLWPEFKSQNGDCLLGGADGKGAGGNFVDYTQSKVRDKFVSIALEIVSKYDLDGVLVDFMLEPRLLKSVAIGGVAAPKEVTLITDMMTKIKSGCASASARLGHKVAFGARVPDSLGFCKDIGIDLQVWFDTKLLDFVVFGGGFQLSDWKSDGQLAAKAGIPFYASFAVSGIYVGNDTGWTNDDELLPRQGRATYNARIAEALLGKAAGCMYTMSMHFDRQIQNSAVAPFDAVVNRVADKRYFVSYTNDRLAGDALKDWTKYRTVESLLSHVPVELAKGVAKFHINVYDDLAALKRDGIEPQVTLVTEAMIPSGVDTTVTFNGKELKSFKRRSGRQYYELSPMLVKRGANEVTVKAKGRNRRGLTATLGNIAVEVKFGKPAKKEASK